MTVLKNNTPGFIGFTEDVRNGAEVGNPKLINSWSEYLYYFAKPNSDGCTDFDCYLPLVVHDYFIKASISEQLENEDGHACYVVSVGTQLPKTRQPTLP